MDCTSASVTPVLVSVWVSVAEGVATATDPKSREVPLLRASPGPSAKPDSDTLCGLFDAVLLMVNSVLWNPLVVGA